MGLGGWVGGRGTGCGQYVAGSACGAPAMGTAAERVNLVQFLRKKRSPPIGHHNRNKK